MDLSRAFSAWIYILYLGLAAQARLGRAVGAQAALHTEINCKYYE